MNNIDKALLGISASQDDLRDWMNKPFRIKDYIYATDSTIIAKVPKDIVSEKYNTIDGKYTKLILPLFDIKSKKILTINTSELRDIISKVELVDEYLDTDEDGKCYECDGLCRVEWEYDTYIKEMDCPVCEGEGTIITEKRTKTGNKILPISLYIDIIKSRFSISRISQLLEFVEKIEIDKIEVIHQTISNGVTVFKVGEIELGLMPVTTGEDMEVIHSF
jgi:hypothetical protein